MNPAPGSAPPALSAGEAAGAAARRAWHGLARVLAGREPVPAWEWHSARERRSAYVALTIATLALCAVNSGFVRGVAEVTPSTVQSPAGVVQHLLALAVVAPLPLAAWRPTLAWRVGWLELLLAPAVPAAWWGGWPWGPPQVLCLLAAFCLAGICHQRLELRWMWTLTLIPWWLWLAAEVPDLGGPVSATIVFAAVAVAVDNVGFRLRAQRALAAETERAEVERARRAVLEERSRIARELHDVVAHHMSLIAVRAETAPYRLAGLTEPARAEFGSLSEAARQALADMRRLLGVLCHDQPPARTPQPQLADLPALIEATCKAGVAVDLTLPPVFDQVPAGVGICAYRIVQESLSNAAQHAPGAAVAVSVSRDAGAVVLKVANGPCATAASRGNGQGPGHGLTGMRERVALLGGSLSAGPAPGGGFVVAAVLPVGVTA